MDLSSLEGPPISDTRFTPQARYRQPDTYYPYIDTTRNRNDRINKNSDINIRRYCPDQSHNHNHNHNHSHRHNPTATLQPPLPRPRARSNPCFSHDRIHDHDHLIQNQDQERGRGRGRGPPTRLIWLDNEQTWLMVDSRAVQNQSQLQPQSQSQSQSQPQSQHRHRYRQSLDLPPPPYGNHQGDLMIAAQPVRPGGVQDVQSMPWEEHRRGDGLSRWGAVARRVNGR